MNARHAVVFGAAVAAAIALAAAAFAASGDGAADAARIAEVGASAQAVPACGSCHGLQGQGVRAQNGPRLAHLNGDYLDRQLEAFAAGERSSAVMAPIAKRLTSVQRAALGAYFASLPPASEAGDVQQKGADLARGRELALNGDWSIKAPSCASCHGPAGQGVGSLTPPLVGQSEDYLLRQLTAFRSGERTGPLDLMAGIAKRLSKSDLRAAAAYYAEPSAATGAVDARGRPAMNLSRPARIVLAGVAVGAIAFAAGALTMRLTASRRPAAASQAFVPPPDSAIPDDGFGRQVALGRELFVNTAAAAPQYVGNDLTCANCHLDRGRLANSAPLWGAFGMFPQYRAKNGHVNTFQERIQGCFKYSMNGKAPPLGDPVLVALESYAAFLSRGAPLGAKLPGRGYLKLKAPPLAPDYARGREVYAANCALCHGADGAGQKADGATVFPPLWGGRSYNWGAGMSNINNAAGFIKANMPFSQGGKLTDQQAWDVAAYIDSKPRPQDPRYAGSVEQTRKTFHDTAQSMYGKTVDGVRLGTDTLTRPGGEGPSPTVRIMRP